MGRSQRHIVIEHGAATNGEAGASGELAPTYVHQLLAEEEVIVREDVDLREGGPPLAVPMGPNYGPLSGSSMAGAIPDWYSGGTPPIEGGPAPYFETFTPAFGYAEQPDLQVVIGGTDFVDGAVVEFEGVGDIAAEFVDSTMLRFMVPLTTLVEKTNHDMKVRNPDGQLSGRKIFQVLRVYIQNLIPAVRLEGTADTMVTAFGDHINVGAVVTWDGTDVVTTMASTGSLEFTATAAMLAAPAVVDVQIRNPNGQVSISDTPFTISAIANAPTLTSVTPNTADKAAMVDLTVTVAGTNLMKGSVAAVDGGDRTTTWVSETEMSFYLNIEGLLAGDHPVHVRHPDDRVTAPLPFTVTDSAAVAAPSISGLSPNFAIFGTGTADITVNGTGFVNGCQAICFGAYIPTVWVSETQVIATVTVPTGAFTTTSSIQIENPDDQLSGLFTLYFLDPTSPTITGLSPASVIAGTPDTLVTITGTNFTADSIINFRGATVPTTLISATQLSFTAPTSTLTAGSNWTFVQKTAADATYMSNHMAFLTTTAADAQTTRRGKK